MLCNRDDVLYTRHIKNLDMRVQEKELVRRGRWSTPNAEHHQILGAPRHTIGPHTRDRQEHRSMARLYL